MKLSDIQKGLLPLFLIVLLALGIRLISLDLIPVFVDEAIYVRWSQVMRTEPSLRFLPLSDGKQPLFMWLTIPFQKIITDPLVAARILSVLSGTASVFVIFFVAFLLTRKITTSLLSALFMAVSPYAFFFDRFALVDSLLTFFGLASILFGVLASQTLRLDFAMLTGGFIGFAMLTKSPAVFFILFVPLYFLFFTPDLKSHLIKAFGLILGIIIISLGIYNILRLGPQFHMIALRNRDYVFSLSEILKHPLNPLWANFKTVVSYFFYFLTPPVFLLIIASLMIGLKKHFKQTLFLILISLFPILAQSLIAKVVTARYFLFTLPPLLILAALALDHLSRIKFSKPTGLLIVLILLWPGLIVLRLLTHPESLNLPRSEKTGYFEIWTAGYGIKEVAGFLANQALSGQPILVGTEGFFGTLPDGLQIYLAKFPNIRVLGIGLFPDKVPAPLTNSLSDNQVYLVINDSRLKIPDPSSVGLELISSYPKPSQPDGRTEHLLFFKVNPYAKPEN